jgi:hypothetical protein
MLFSLQVAMVSKALSEIRPGKELWKIKAESLEHGMQSCSVVVLDMNLIDHQV